jgi:hypothetical protein
MARLTQASSDRSLASPNGHLAFWPEILILRLRLKTDGKATLSRESHKLLLIMIGVCAVALILLLVDVVLAETPVPSVVLTHGRGSSNDLSP